MKRIIELPDDVVKAIQNGEDYRYDIHTAIAQSKPYNPTVEPFTQLEKEEIADAITYLLDAELLEENGYTEEVIKALKSALKKVGGAE